MNSCSVLISLLCIVYNSYSPRTEFVGLKKVYPAPEILWVASAWSESKLLRNIIWWIRVATNLFWIKFYVRNFYLWKPQNKKFLDDEICLPKPYAWSLQRHKLFICYLYHFELCQILWPFEFLFILTWSRITYTPPPYAKTSTPKVLGIAPSRRWRDPEDCRR